MPRSVLVLVALLTSLPGGVGTVQPPSPPSALQAVTATRIAVQLTWSGASGAQFVVERKPLGASWTPPPPPAPSPIVTSTVAAAAFTDKAIDPFATYVYRVRAVAPDKTHSSASNEITIGPPPIGFSQIARAAKGLNDPSQFAPVFAIALDGNDDPAVAYVISDPDNNTDAADNTLNFVSWNRARYQWNAPVTVGVVGNHDTRGPRDGLALAHDAAANRRAIAHMVGDHELRVAFSDDGASWHAITVEKVGQDDNLGGSSVALDRGQIYLAYDAAGHEGRRDLVFRSGAVTDPPEKWKRTTAPLLADTWDTRRMGVSLALDDAGKPAIAYWLNPAQGYNVTLAFWRPGQTSATKVSDTADSQSDSTDASLAIRQQRAAIAFYARRDDKFFEAMNQLWIAQSTDGGASWTTAQPLPNDGGNSMGAPVSIAMSAKGRTAVVAPVDGGNNSGTKCGQPKLLLPSDSGQWRVCAPETTGTPTRDARTPAIAYAANEKLYLVFGALNTGGALQPGLALWRER